MHEAAMGLAMQAHIQNNLGNASQALFYNEQAFLWEREAAMLTYQANGNHRSTSILLKSAVWLALHCEKFEEAKTLIHLAFTLDLHPYLYDVSPSPTKLPEEQQELEVTAELIEAALELPEEMVQEFRDTYLFFPQHPLEKSEDRHQRILSYLRTYCNNQEKLKKLP